MELEMKIRMQLNKKTDESIKEDLTKIFEEKEKKVMGNSNYTSSTSLRDNKIVWDIKAQDVRVYGKILQLKNQLSPILGKHKLGIRKLTIESLTVKFEVEKKPEGNLTIPFIDSISFSDNTCTLSVKDFDDEFIKGNYIDRMIRRIKEKIEEQQYAGKAEFWELMWESEPTNIHFQKDPTIELVDRKWIFQGPTKGKWFLGPKMTKIMRTMEKIAIDEILLPLGFQEVMEPTHEPLDILLKTGHMEGMPGEFYYVSEPISRDPKVWETFRDKVKITRKIPTEDLKELLSVPKSVCCWVQCPVIYWSLSGRTIAKETLPALMFDRAAVSNRYESGGRHGLERVDEFHRLEPVYVGFKDQILDIREKLIERYKYVFNEILQLEWRMAWVTPFYMQHSGKLGVEDEKEKIKGTIDFEAYLPYRGSRENSEWLEFQNLTIVGDKYTKAFNIKTQKGELWSGCSGIGLERWAIAFLSQKGFDPDNWPQKFRDYVGEMPRELKFL